ncbi:ABC transporter ATP-binding protein, partial [Actinomadura rubrisoli]
MSALLRVRDLKVVYRGSRGAVAAVEGASLSVGPGEVVALVGESGSGKSTLAHAVLGILPAGARIEGGSVGFGGTDLTALGEPAWRTVRGRSIALVPQDAGVSLNPVARVGAQVAEVLRVHGLADRSAAPSRAVELLERAGLPDAALRARQYPHELSGGMRQRVLIAIALAGDPRLIVADEPTSALDTTVQHRILDHLDGLARESGTAVLLITHDLAVARDRADRVAMMAGGRVVEEGPARRLLASPEHPYTRALVADAPALSGLGLRTAERPPAPDPP